MALTDQDHLLVTATSQKRKPVLYRDHQMPFLKSLMFQIDPTKHNQIVFEIVCYILRVVFPSPLI